jgi:glycosyltransferase involved in cell wall biosynthesis
MTAWSCCATRLCARTTNSRGPFLESNRAEKVILYVNGWIAWDTGSRIILRALDILKDRGVDCRLIVAGRVASNDGEALIARAEAEFKGELAQRKALELYRACDLALTLYDPSVSINRHAESNKWGDCVFLETPFIVNSEVETAAKFVRAGAALSFPYNDPAALADIVQSVARDPGILERLRVTLRAFRTEYKPFEINSTVYFHRFWLLHLNRKARNENCSGEE